MQQAILDRSTGEIKWITRGEKVPLDISRAIYFSNRAVEEAVEQRQGFRGIMGEAELILAQTSRARQDISYPDTCPETEESRIKSRAMARERHRGENSQIPRKEKLFMSDPIVDLKTGKVTFPKPEAKKASAAPADMAYVAVPKSTMGKLVALATKDGFKPDAETERGIQNQSSKAARTYILMAVEMLLTHRASGS